MSKNQYEAIRAILLQKDEADRESIELCTTPESLYSFMKLISDEIVGLKLTIQEQSDRIAALEREL